MLLLIEVRLLDTPETTIEPILHFIAGSSTLFAEGEQKLTETLITSDAPSILKIDGPFICGRNSSAL